MTLLKFAIPPDNNGYSFTDGEEVLSVALQGGASKYRLDILNANIRLNVQWTLDRNQYNYIRAFYKSVLISGSLPFLLDLYVDNPFELTEHECYIIPKTFGLKSQKGLSFVVGCSLEVKPVAMTSENLNTGLVYGLFQEFSEDYCLSFDDITNVQLDEDLNNTDEAMTSNISELTRTDWQGGARTNLHILSEDFDNAGFTRPYLSIVANAVNSPFGDLTADKLFEPNTNLNTKQIYLTNAITIISGKTYCASVYVKAAERFRLRLFVLDSVADADGFYIDANLQTMTYSSGNNGSGVKTAQGMENIGNGWIRVWIAGTISTRTAIRVKTYIADDNGVLNHIGITNYGCYIWGAQFEEGSAPSAYIKTTSVIASVYDVSPTILYTEARTNYYPRSNSLAIGYSSTNGTISPTYQTVPDGSSQICKWIPNTGAPKTSGTYLIGPASVSIANGWASFYIKNNGLDVVSVAFAEAGSATIIIYLNTKTYYNDKPNNVNINIQDIGNGWLKVSFKSLASNTFKLFMFLNTSSNTPDGTIGVSIWGMQVSDTLASYIPTTDISKTLIDYYKINNTVVLTVPPDQNALLKWSGTKTVNGVLKTATNEAIGTGNTIDRSFSISYN